MNLVTITHELSITPPIQSSEFLKDICGSVIAIYPNGIPSLPWAGYLAEEHGKIVGTCAFKSVPVSGAVEIAYFTFPDYEGQGVATRMAQKLVDLAIRHGVACIRAQTLPEQNASTHLLQKLGFKFMGEVNHPEDGVVWEWHK